jgi:uncharacterized protein YndB with AHSA1/START domain
MPVDFTQLRLCVLVDAPVETVFEAWTTSPGLARWFVTASFAPEWVEEGTRYRWTWANDYSEEGEITQLEGPSLLAFTFGTDVGVVVRFGEVDGRTMVELVQHHSHASVEDRQETYVGCYQGWTFYLTNLKSVLETGADLRETRLVDLPGLVNL